MNKHNVLLDRLPDTVNIGGREYPIDTDFRAGIEFELAVQNGAETLADLLCPWYGSVGYPQDIVGAVDAAIWFYRCGVSEDKPQEENRAQAATRRHTQGYCFDMDADAILASFWQAYRIDLTTASLHWWVFRALLSGLPEESEFKRRVYIRTCDTKGMSKKQKEQIMKQRKALEIKRPGKKETLAERDRKMREYVAQRLNGGD